MNTTPMIRPFETADGCFAPVASLTPGEAAAHAPDFDDADLRELRDEALMAVVRIRPIRMRWVADVRGRVGA